MKTEKKIAALVCFWIVINGFMMVDRNLKADVSPFTLNLWQENEVPNAIKKDFGAERSSDEGTISRRWNVHNPYMDVYLVPDSKTCRPIVVICPGGGYQILAEDHEGQQIAEWFNSFGVSAVVVKYRLPSGLDDDLDYRYPHNTPLLDVQRAIRSVRFNADKWNIDAEKIGVMGFSAGGHLASTAATHFDAGKGDAADPIDRLSSRPDFAILMYPVISFDEDITHMGSRNNLIGKNPPAELVELYSNEKQVTSQTPPTFLVHANDDASVPAENSVRFYLALRKAGVPAEMHIYNSGGHGFGLANPKMPAAKWTEACQLWLQEIKVVTP